MSWNRIEFDDDDLRSAYLERRKNVKDIAARYNCTPPTVYRRLRELGIVRSNSEAHKGLIPGNRRGWYYDSQGYIYIQLRAEDPYWAMSNKAGYVREHRLVMAQHLNRCLERWEVVHHVNGIKDDNRPENLVLYPSQGDHLALTRLTEENKRLKLELEKCRAAIKATINE